MSKANAGPVDTPTGAAAAEETSVSEHWRERETEEIGLTLEPADPARAHSRSRAAQIGAGRSCE